VVVSGFPNIYPGNPSHLQNLVSDLQGLIGTYAQNAFMRACVQRKVLSMNRSCKQAVLMLIFGLASYPNTSATTCVANKISNLKQVCGRVVDPTDVPIPGVEVELLDSASNILQHALTNESGTFDMQNISPGQYVIRVQFAGFATAWQPFVLTKNKPNARCNKPMQVHLQLAGKCSSVNRPK
jgi:hypothetical protein